jgi:hypothetical protein
VASALATIAPASGAGDDREAAQAVELSRQVRADFEARDTLYRYIDAVLYGAIDYVPPKGYRKIARATHNPLAVYMTNTITAALTVDPPEVQFPVLGVGDASRTNATLRAHFFDGSWSRQEDEAEVPIFRRFTHSVVCKGEAALKTVPRSRMAWSSYTDYAKTLTDRLTDGDLRKLSIDEKDRLYSSKTEEFKKTQAPYPIKSIDVQPETFYYWKGEDGLTLVDEHKRVPYLETLVRYGQALDREGRIVPQGMGQALPADEWRHAMSGTSQLAMDELWTWDRCFPAETVVSSTARVRGVSRRWYSGPLAEITTAGGQKLAGTPNHPVLTDRGWVGIGDLVEGDRVVRGAGLDQRAARHQDDQDVQTTIGQIFDFAHVARRADVRPVSELDFHGDGQQGEVHVVPIDGVLWDRIKAALAQPAGEQRFAVGRRSRRALLAGQRRAPQRLGVGGPTADRRVSSLRQGTPFGFGHAGQPRPHRLTARALDPQAPQPLADGRGGPVDSRSDHHRRLAQHDVAVGQGRVVEREAAGTIGPVQAIGLGRGAQHDTAIRERGGDGGFAASERGREGHDPLSGGVALDEVVQVSRRPFAGYVYNLQTESERYIASNIIVHNCRYLVSGPGQMGQSEASRAGSLVRSFKHRYGDPVTKSLRGPYAHCLGTTTASRLPERAGLGVLYGFLDLFVYLDELLTYQQINAALTSLASFKRNRPPGTGLPDDASYGEDGRISARQPVTIEPGAIFPDDVGPIEMPRAGQALGDTIAQTREFIELILPKVLQGVVDTTDSGYQLALAARLGRIAFDPMVANIRRAAARRVSFESWLIEHEIGERVYVTGVPIGKKGQRRGPEAGVISIGPDELNGVHTGYVVKLQPEDKASELVEVRKHGELVQQGFEARATAQEALGLNPEEEEVKMLTEQMKQDPAIQADFKQRVTQKLGLLEQQAVQAGDAALAGAGVQPAPQAGAALQGMGDVAEAGQTLPFAPGGPGQMGVSAQAPGGLPASIPGQPPGVPPQQQQVPSLGTLMAQPVG